MNVGNCLRWIVLALFAVALVPAAAMASNADLEDKVVVYSTHGESMLELVADAFEKDSGVKVEFINKNGSRLAGINFQHSPDACQQRPFRVS